jgi:hypothetical chaperone protein
MSDEIAFSLDFGTTNTLLGASTSHGIIPTLPISKLGQDSSCFQSIMYTPSQHLWHFGQDAIDTFYKSTEKGHLYRSFKSLLASRKPPAIKLWGQEVLIEELVGRFLREVRQCGNSYFQTDVTKVMVGRPAFFSNDPKADWLAQTRLEKALFLAGFKDIKFCYEPVAAINHFSKKQTQEKIILLCDLGGGHSNFSITKTGSNNKADCLLALKGIPLGGDSYNSAIILKSICEHFGSKIKYTIPNHKTIKKIPKSILEKICTSSKTSFLTRNEIEGLLKKLLPFQNLNYI